jgi:hypothetical protein
MKKASLAVALLLAAGLASAGVGVPVKHVKADTEKQAGIVSSFDGATLTLVVEGAANASFTVDALTQFKFIDDKNALVGKPVIVVYSEKDGAKIARVVGGSERPHKETPRKKR